MSSFFAKDHSYHFLMDGYFSPPSILTLVFLPMILDSEECQTPQPRLLLESQYFQEITGGWGRPDVPC